MRLRLGFLLLCVAFAVACTASTVDLSGVQDFAKQVDAAAATIDQIPSNYAQACDTMLEYQRDTTLGMLGNPPPSPSPFTTRPVASLGPPPIPSASPIAPAPPVSPSDNAPLPSPIGPVATPTSGPTCDYAHDQAKQWKTLNTTVELYVKGLGKIAGVTTSPSQSQYQSFADSVASDGLLSQPVAEGIGSLIVTIGNRIIAQEQQRDLIDVINASQQKNVLNVVLQAGENAALWADVQYHQTLVAVNSRYISTIASETLLLSALNKRFETMPNAQVILGREPMCPNPAEHTKTTLKCVSLSQLQSSYQIQASINGLRMRILRQRARWIKIDSEIQTNDSQLQAYVNAMHDIGQVNQSLVKHETGFAGFMAEAGPWINDLAAQSGKLAGVIK